MPSYQWIVPRDSVPFEKRQEVALACTDIHCGSTGAPRSFVQVTFHEYDGESEHATPYFLDAGNRAGRPEDVKRKLMSDLLAAFSQINGVSPDMVSGRLSEGPGRWSMEAGKILPEAGEEGPEWYTAEAAAD